MKVSRNRVVYIEYEARDESGALVESTDGSGAFAYLHGQGNILPGLEEALDGVEEGFSATVVLPPAEAYGERVEEACVQVPRSSLGEGIKGEVGERVQVNGPDGVIEFTITATGDESVTLDANYPLAGHTLTIDVTVGQVREAHKDEVRHKRLHHAGHHLMVADSSRLDDED